MDRGIFVPSPFLNYFAKEWPEEFSGSRKPDDDRPCLELVVETLRSLGLEPEGDDTQLFMASYDDGLTSFAVRNAIRFLQGAKSNNPHDQVRSKRRGTAWIDDRTCDRIPPQEVLVASLMTSGPVITPTTGMSLEAGGTQHAASVPRPHATDLSLNSHTSYASIECDITDAAAGAAQALHRAESGDGNSLYLKLGSPRSHRHYRAPLTADDLKIHLREKRFDHTDYLDADRRLIQISDPDAYDFLALVKTATAHQQRSLQEVICKYLALDTSIKATIPEEGYRVFQLEFHIPYYALRRSRPEQDFTGRKKRTHRGWMNVAFLDIRETGAEEEGVWGIHQAQISVTLCGTDNSRWIAYCFEDQHFNEDGELGEDEHTATHQSDQIAGGEVGAETTIWDPREYYLRVFLIRMRKVQKEWVDLLSFIESGIQELSWGRFFFPTTRSGIPPEVRDSAALAWIDSSLELLGKLLNDISKTNDAWARFTSANGDFTYFSDTHSNPDMIRTFQQLHDVFGHMMELEKRLRRIAEQCEKKAQTVNLRLTSDSKKNAELTVYFISPFAIVSTFFAIPVPIMGFDRNIVSFSVAILLYTVILQALLFFWGGKVSRQPWWEKLSRRTKAVLKGDPALTTKDESGVTVLQRRNTHVAFDEENQRRNSARLRRQPSC